MNIGILTTNQITDDQRLMEAAINKGHQPTLLDLRKISIELSPGLPSIYYENEDVTKKFKAIIPRLNVSFTDYGINVLQQFICARVYVSETPEALRLGRDKLKCLQYLLEKGLPFPDTGIAYSNENFSSIISHLKTPVVVKLIESTEGTGVFLAKSKKELENMIKTFGLLGASFLVQEFVEEAAGEDVRAFVVGGRVVASMRRKSQDSDFRANVSLGGHSFQEKLTGEEERVVLAATQSIGVNVAGVDFVRSKRGPLLLEINVSPDFTGEQGIESITGYDVASAIIDFAVEQANNFQKSHITSGLLKLDSRFLSSIVSS